MQTHAVRKWYQGCISANRDEFFFEFVRIMKETYIEPQKGLQAFTCPHCYTMTQVEFAKYRFQSVG